MASETFDGGTPPAGKNLVNWSSETKGKIQLVNDPVLASGKAFEGKKVVGILPFATLSNPGDSVTVQFDFRLAGPIIATEHGFKVGLFEGGDPNDPWFFASGTGYRWNVTTGPLALPATMARESGGPGQKVLYGQDTTVLSQSDVPFTLNNTDKHTATITIQNTGGTLNLTLSIDNKLWTFQSSDPLAPSVLALTRFAIRSDDNTFLFDNFTVNVQMSTASQ